jgi:hypothetical protein
MSSDIEQLAHLGTVWLYRYSSEILYRNFGKIPKGGQCSEIQSIFKVVAI